jgi:hypothetical protein
MHAEIDQDAGTYQDNTEEDKFLRSFPSRPDDSDYDARDPG